MKPIYPTKGEVQSCLKKKKYDTKVDALLGGAEKYPGGTTSAYRCAACRMWHLTSNVK